MSKMSGSALSPRHAPCAPLGAFGAMAATSAKSGSVHCSRWETIAASISPPAFHFRGPLTVARFMGFSLWCVPSYLARGRFSVGAGLPLGRALPRSSRSLRCWVRAAVVGGSGRGRVVHSSRRTSIDLTMATCSSARPTIRPCPFQPLTWHTAVLC